MLDELGVTDVAVIGLAKRLEESGSAEPDPLIMPRNSEGLYLLQRVADGFTDLPSPTTATSGPNG